MFDKILNDDPSFDEETSDALIELIKGLLQKNPEDRMEFVKTIKTHRFFS